LKFTDQQMNKFIAF